MSDDSGDGEERVTMPFKFVTGKYLHLLPSVINYANDY
jgi:hypothetical protein